MKPTIIHVLKLILFVIYYVVNFVATSLAIPYVALHAAGVYNNGIDKAAEAERIDRITNPDKYRGK